MRSHRSEHSGAAVASAAIAGADLGSRHRPLGCADRHAAFRLDPGDELAVLYLALHREQLASNVKGRRTKHLLHAVGGSAHVGCNVRRDGRVIEPRRHASAIRRQNDRHGAADAGRGCRFVCG
jgi:hypothetical protein